ncbi:TraB/GumN family protein [Rhizobiaceae bacterium BDR2-2]|uniref:TraB/GumN family protein n=1 Tax=Ectorhizobium quercum TaxID=2965071 RepID=A0AAE3N293_9HYPH|nr:TraB/GumN family protein [Ectorhizobium quercum]MCX8999229.1 TraB/GumN family protein [Ectorhizobium quercum]
MPPKSEAAAIAVADRLSRPLLHLAALLPLLLLALLVAALAAASSVRAEDGDACNGKSLLPEFQARDPALYGRILDEAERIPNGKAIFWKIEKVGLPPSWLLGTMHVADPRVTALPEAARAPYEAAATVVIETTDVLDHGKAAAAMLARPDLTMLADGKTIESLLDAKDTAALEAGLKARGIPMIAVARMQPWLIASFVALPTCELARKQSSQAILDKKLAVDAQAAGREVLGLETMIEQFTAMAALPAEFHLKGLIETLALGDRMEDVFETMTELYLDGRTGEIMPMLKAAIPGMEGAGEGYAAFEERLIRDRNHVMADRAAPILEKGNVFIAVGALHLPGEDGVVALLEKKGFTLTPAH